MDSFKRQNIRKAIEVLKIRITECQSAETERMSMLQNEMKELESHIAPIHMLPRELLVEIWSYNCAHYGLFRGKDWRPFPVIASWVTRYWRNVAINTPTLWCDIGLRYDRSLELLKTQLERSGACVLHIKLQHPTRDVGGNITEAARQMIERLTIAMAHIDRWHRLYFNWHRTGLKKAVGLLRDASAPRLKYLHMSCSGGSQYPVFRGGAGALTDVFFRRMNLQANSILLTGLSSLHLRNIGTTSRLTHAEFKGVLDASPNLQDLMLYGSCVQYIVSVDSDYPAIHVPSLRSLIICPCTNDDDVFVSKLFNVFFAPGLLSLALRRWELAVLKMFITAVAPTNQGSRYSDLSELILCDCTFDEDLGDDSDSENSDLQQNNSLALELFQCFPSIKYLRLEGEQDSGFLKALMCHKVCGPSDGIVCPRLHTLALLHFNAVDQSLAREFILWRISMGYPITELHVVKEFFAVMGLEEQNWFHAHVGVGLVTITGRRGWNTEGKISNYPTSWPGCRLAKVIHV